MLRESIHEIEHTLKKMTVYIKSLELPTLSNSMKTLKFLKESIKTLKENVTSSIKSGEAMTYETLYRESVR